VLDGYPQHSGRDEGRARKDKSGSRPRALHVMAFESKSAMPDDQLRANGCSRLRVARDRSRESPWMKYLRPRRRVLMRSRVAILIAFSVVFAPGWPGRGASRPEGSDLAARVLAPTIDEGATREAATGLKHQLSARQLERWRPGLTSATTVASSVTATALVILWIVAAYPGRLSSVRRFLNRFSRAPPHLQPA
jgi:hypothetical protein